MTTSVQLSEHERNALSRVLDIYLSDLRAEIAGTDNWRFKDQLRGERAVLDDILTRIQGQISL